MVTTASDVVWHHQS